MAVGLEFFTTIQDDEFRFKQWNPEAPTHFENDNLFGIIANASNVRPSRYVAGSDEKHFVRPGEIVPVRCEDEDLLALKPNEMKVASVFSASHNFFNLNRLERWPGVVELIKDMGDRGHDGDYEGWDLGTLLRNGLRHGQRGLVEGPFRNRFVVESFDSQGNESPHNLKYDPIAACAFAFMNDRTDRNWLLLCNLAIGAACSGIRYGYYGMGSNGWYRDDKSVGLAEYGKGNGAQGLGFRPSMYDTNIRGLLLVDQLGLTVKPIKMAINAILSALARRPTDSYKEAYGCRAERFTLDMECDLFAMTGDAKIAQRMEERLEWYRYRDEDEETGFTLQDVGYASPWMVIPFYEAQARAAALIERHNLLADIYHAGVAAWEAAKVVDADGKHAWVRYRYDNGRAPDSQLTVKDAHHVAFCCNFLEMANHPDLEAAERAAFSGIGDSLAKIREGSLTQLFKISARDVDQGAGWTKEAFSLIQNASRGTWL